MKYKYIYSNFSCLICYIELSELILGALSLLWMHAVLPYNLVKMSVNVCNIIFVTYFMCTMMCSPSIGTESHIKVQIRCHICAALHTHTHFHPMPHGSFMRFQWTGPFYRGDIYDGQTAVSPRGASLIRQQWPVTFPRHIDTLTHLFRAERWQKATFPHWKTSQGWRV